MRILVTGVSGLIGSNLAAAAVQQSWGVLGSWSDTPVDLRGARTAGLDMADRRAIVDLATGFEPDVVVHAAGHVDVSRMEREPYVLQLNQLGIENSLAAARAVRAHYVLVSCDWVFSGHRPAGQSWNEDDPTEPVNAYGRSKLSSEEVVRRWGGKWLITRPAGVYGVNLSRPTEAHDRDALGKHVWGRSGWPLRWLARLREGRSFPAPANLRQSPTYAWDYAQRVCELIAQECEGVINTAGPTPMSRLEQVGLLADVFGCSEELVRKGTTAAFLEACEQDRQVKLPSNTALADEKSRFVLGRAAVEPREGHERLREQLHRVLAA